jgi:uncharacterized LabA/DUF88 family protein
MADAPLHRPHSCSGNLDLAARERRAVIRSRPPPSKRATWRNVKRPHTNQPRVLRVLVLADESNVTSSAKAANRKLDWLKLRDNLVGDRELIEMVVYAGLPPAMTEWQAERDKKNKFLHWLRSNGFLVMTKEGAPGAESHYKANVDVLMAIDAMELANSMKPDVVVLLTGDADFADLALKLRRCGIRVEVASTAQTLGAGLKAAANEFMDLTPLLKTFEPLS